MLFGSGTTETLTRNVVIPYDRSIMGVIGSVGHKYASRMRFAPKISLRAKLWSWHEAQELNVGAVSYTGAVLRSAVRGRLSAVPFAVILSPEGRLPNHVRRSNAPHPPPDRRHRRACFRLRSARHALRLLPPGRGARGLRRIDHRLELPDFDQSWTAASAG